MSARLTLVCLAGVCLAVPAKAQVLLAPDQYASINRLIDSKAKQNSLRCHVRPWLPHLDFNLRFLTGFGLSAPLGQFSVGEELISFLRVTPEGRESVLLTESFDVPQVPPEMTGQALRTMDVEMSGSFVVGEGRYQVELVLLNQRGHSFYKRWKLKTSKYRKDAVPLASKPLMVLPVVADSYDGKLDPKGVRLTVLLDATATDPSAAKLWNYAFLSQLLASLLKQVPCQSVRIVAFNLDQQREIFRQENFDAAGFSELATALRDLQLVTISYENLRRGSWLEFLLRITREQISASNPSDAVVFIGSWAHFSQKAPKGLWNSVSPGSTHFFYFHVDSSSLADAIDYLTRALHGTVFRIYSPDDFGTAMQKMLAQVRPKGVGVSVAEHK
jgi:hypothetical protein